MCINLTEFPEKSNNSHGKAVVFAANRKALRIPVNGFPIEYAAKELCQSFLITAIVRGWRDRLCKAD